MNISEQIRMLCGRLNISQAELARRTGQTSQNFSQKMSRGSFTVDELEKIAEAAGTIFERKFLLPNGEKV